MSAHVLIAGASLAGLRTAEALRDAGFGGRITLVGDEPHPPYDRPPLSKQVLSGWVGADQTELPALRAVDADWRLGAAAADLDLAGRSVGLADGARIAFDQLVIATGARARPWPVAAEAALDGVFVLRTRGDAAALRARLAARPGRVVVIGAGFTGCEVASSCIDAGLPVTVVEATGAPLLRALGDTIGAFAADLQGAHGVDLRTGVAVAGFEDDGTGRLAVVVLGDGARVEATVAVVCLGAAPNVEWLAGSGLAAGPQGLLCDSACRALDTAGQPVAGVFGAGDVVRIEHPRFPGEPLRTEHWGAACEQAAVAGANILRADPDLRRIDALPAFWSMQFGACLKLAGAPERADATVLLQGSVESGRFVVGYGRGDRLVAVATVNQAHWLSFYEAQIRAGAAFPPTYRRVDAPISPQKELAS
ncbi:MAG: FAD-dependent oxidoreductase [Alphaproteobacteria bacterium]|nr:FAD-dependent oxidoreductase [Alphaproteobacteria bacterium]MBU1516104.1 FAD-dependent oxidoreductase [Alphaproteobacteria bacterium]MBU2092681.1 FAD-dependent oxidoreductase [Alphaproteobacteria bacterium]MBU2153794.1 FAD-dependent oxidoreductase [Alphaproteobacteria bacterium]MBU2308422.1 FAD-dependent oxidoreductase [Alphaproteobacteria bacterium]